MLTARIFGRSFIRREVWRAGTSRRLPTLAWFLVVVAACGAQGESESVRSCTKSRYQCRRVCSWEKLHLNPTPVGTCSRYNPSPAVANMKEICSAATSPEPLNDHRHQIQHDAPAADR
eukprot:2554204-Amphidinium_carterae.1